MEYLYFSSNCHLHFTCNTLNLAMFLHFWAEDGQLAPYSDLDSGVQDFCSLPMWAFLSPFVGCFGFFKWFAEFHRHHHRHHVCTFSKTKNRAHLDLEFKTTVTTMWAALSQKEKEKGMTTTVQGTITLVCVRV